MRRLPVSAGELDQRVTLQQRASGQDSLGQASGAWQDVATVWARREPLRGRELFAAGEMQASADVRFTIRWRTAVTASMRVLWNSVPHDIVGEPIDVDSGGHTLELMCATGLRNVT